MDTIDQAYVQQLRRDYIQGMNEILSANDDLVERIQKLGITTVYHRDDDALILTIGRRQEASSESIDNTLYLRIDFDTLKLVGVELYHFSRHISERSPHFAFLFDLLQLAGTTKLAVLPRPSEAAVVDPLNDVRALVMA